MAIVIGLSVGLIIAGLLMVLLCKNLPPTLQTVIKWIGYVLIVIGLILLVTPVLNWIYVQLRIMIGSS